MARYTATVRADRRLELSEEARRLVKPGQLIDIYLPDVPTTDMPQPDHPILATLEKIAKRQEGRRHTDGSETDAIIREGRDGGMYGYDKTE